MTSLVIRNIARLLTLVPRENDRLGQVENAAVIVENGQINWTGPESELILDPSREYQFIDAERRLVTPGLVEPHAHPMFAGSRANEFELRSRGATYVEIQQAGGGILSTARATNQATDAELIQGTSRRIHRLLAHGVTLCEAKSGYALSVEGELRMLRLLRQTALEIPVELSPTLLAHVIPPDADRAEYIDRFCSELIPAAARISENGRALAESLDVFCDVGAFTLSDTRQLLEAGRAAGLGLRVHAEQLSHTGAAQLAASFGARSVEHLEYLTEADMAALARAGTVCTLLPGAALTLNLPFPNARKMIDAGCEVAIGTDLNPGSSLSENLPLMMSIACMQMKLTVEEAWLGVTVIAAKALNRPDAGRLSMGSPATLVLWNSDDHRELLQHYGMARAESVLINGQPIKS